MADPGKMEEGLVHAEVAPDEEGIKKHDGKVGEKEVGGDSIEKEKEEKVEEQQLEEQPLVKQKTKRVATLDAFRGLTIVVSAFIRLRI